MALELERSRARIGLSASVKAGAGRLGNALAAIRRAILPAGRWLRRQPLVRFVSSSLTRRILVSNLIGLGMLLLGILYLSQHHAWLIDAKRDSLQAQGEIIAAAIAANATLETERIVLDPDKLPEAENARIPFRDDGFAALELSIRPERIAPILRRLIQPTNTRARIYSRDGTLIVDSAMLLSRGQIIRAEPDETTGDRRLKTKNFWTRLTYWLIDKELPVYREIGTAKGTAYPEVRMALSGTTTPMLLLNEKGEQIVSMAVPIQRMKTVQGVLLLSTRPGEIDEILADERSVILLLAAVALAAAIVTSLLLARTVAEPMRRLSEAAKHVSGNVNARQDLPEYPDRSDEVGQMARAFRAMTAALCRRIEASEKFAADVAHELKNPLTAARSTAEALAYARNDEQRAELVDQIQGELRRLNRLITDVSSASRLDAELARQQTEPVPLLDIVDSVVAIFRDKAETRGCRLEAEYPATRGAQDFIVIGNDGRLAQVLTNLVDNGISFSPKGGCVKVSIDRRVSEIEITVDDEGPGIDEDKLATIFDRFYTYRPTAYASRGDNSGLGLSISREIVVAHGGQIWAENRIEGSGAERRRTGSRFVVRLPASARGGSTGGRRG